MGFLMKVDTHVGDDGTLVVGVEGSTISKGYRPAKVKTAKQFEKLIDQARVLAGNDDEEE